MQDRLGWNEVDLDCGEVWRHLMDWVREVERVQSDIFDRFVKLAAPYNPNRRGVEGSGFHGNAKVQENVIATNVDSITGTIASTDIRASRSGSAWNCWSIRVFDAASAARSKAFQAASRVMRSSGRW